MNKLIKTLLLSATFFSFLNADFIRIEAGAGLWIAQPTGSLKGDQDADESLNDNFDLAGEADIDKENNYYAWAYVKHFLPVVPNARMEYSTTSFSSTLSSDIKFDGKTYQSGSDKFSLSLTQLDTIAYYNLLDNTLWITADVGFGIKATQGYIGFESETLGNKEESLDATIPILYGRARVELPFSGWSVDGSLKMFKYGDSSIHDAQLKVEYKIVETILDLGVEFGYREQNFNIQEDLGTITGIDISSDFTLGGYFAGVQVKF
jgi:outer membrane protein